MIIETTEHFSHFPCHFFSFYKSRKKVAVPVKGYVHIITSRIDIHKLSHIDAWTRSKEAG